MPDGTFPKFAEFISHIQRKFLERESPFKKKNLDGDWPVEAGSNSFRLLIGAMGDATCLSPPYTTEFNLSLAKVSQE